MEEVFEIKEYTKDDFLNSDEPYKWLYQFKDDKFKLNQLIVKLSEMAKEVKVGNFKTLFKGYCDAQKKSVNNDIVGNVTCFEGQELDLDSGSWVADDFGVSAITQFGEIQACPHPIMPVLRLINIDSNTEKLKIAYRKNKSWRHVIADKQTLASASQIISLANSGIAVNSENAKFLVRYLCDIENINYDRIPEKNSIGRLGWIDGQGFAPYVENLVFDGEGNFKAYFESVCEGGNYSDWLEICRDIRQKSLYGRIILAASFASALVKPLSCLPFFVHLWGGTEAGKTVGLMLAASVWANPEMGRFIHTFNSTAVGREKSAAFVNSMPLILDELQIQSDKKQFDKDIYMLSEGVGRTRGNKNGGVDKVPTWSNCILTSGEMPITSGNSGGGAVNRIIEVECKERLFENPRKVADTVKRNFGFAGRKLVEWLKDESNVEAAKKMLDTYRQQFDKIDVTDKQALAICLILTADNIVTKGIFKDNAQLKIKEVVNFLKTTQEISANERGYDYICEYVAMNRKRFDDSDNTGELWGTMDANFVYIVRAQFTKICDEGGYNAQALLSWLKQNNLIEATKGNLKTKCMGGMKISCVWLKKPEYVESEKRGFVEVPEWEQDQLPF